jgi:PhnB protein
LSQEPSRPKAPALGITPILVADNAEAAVAFYKRAFGALELARITAPDGKRLLHVRLQIFASRLVVMDELAEVNGMGSRFMAPSHLDGTSVTLHVQVEDASALWANALAAGAVEVIPLALQFWGEYYGRLKDPFGHEWTIAQFVAPLTDDEVEQASASVFRNQ